MSQLRLRRSRPVITIAGFAFLGFCLVCLVVAETNTPGSQQNPIMGKRAFADYTQQKPGTFRKITLADLPEPYASKSVDNGPDESSRPANAWPQALPGFKVVLYAESLDYPRLLRVAPNGDLFLAESHTGEVKAFRGVTKDGKAEQSQVFATGLRQPFGIAFYPSGKDPQWIYVGNTDSVVRFPYRNGDLKARGASQKIADLPGGGRLRGGGHWTRDIAFSKDDRKMYVSVGSRSNNDDPDTHPEEKDRADILEFNPDGSAMRIYASGLRNAVGIAVDPLTGELWASTNERDELGSWNRSRRNGYEVVRVPLKNGKADGTYEDFLTGFVTPDGRVWGRPVGVAVGNDGALFVSDDVSKSIWRVSYVGQ